MLLLNETIPCKETLDMRRMIHMYHYYLKYPLYLYIWALEYMYYNTAHRRSNLEG